MKWGATLLILRQEEQFTFHLSVPLLPSSRPGQSLNPPSIVSELKPYDQHTQRQIEQEFAACGELLHALRAGDAQGEETQCGDASAALERLGKLLFNLLLPPGIQKGLHELAAGAPLLLITGDVDVPWELLHDGEQVLALKHMVGRQWVSEQAARRNAPGSHTGRSFLFIANPTGDLDAADAEVEALMTAFDSAPEAITTRFLCRSQASRLHVAQALASGKYDVIHYSGHARESALLLSDGELGAQEVHDMMRGQPFVFLNTCQASKGAAGDTFSAMPYRERAGSDSLASAFILGGAAAVVSTHWKVADSTSREFAEWFYNWTMEGLPVGEALRRTRVQMKQAWPADPLWASFVLFGDPRHLISGVARRETRLATVLVGQLSGLVPLFEALGLEAGADAQRQLIAELSRVARQYGGQVRGALADLFGVRFGIPTTLGDDATRAIRAALEMERAVQSWSVQAAAWTPQVELTIGISSGRVLGIQEQTADGYEYQIAGSIVDVATSLARLSLGEISVDAETYRLARDGFVFQDAGAHTVAPGSQPIKSYLVLGEKRHPSHASRVIGREEELAQLHKSWSAATAGRGRVVGIAGAAGVGKTCLVEAFKERLAAQPCRCISAACSSHNRNAPYSLLAQIIMQLAATELAEGEAIRRDHVARLVRGIIPAETADDDPLFREGLALLGQVAGLSFAAPSVATLDARLRQKKLSDLVQAVLQKETERQPVLLVLDDLQWADEASLNVVAQVAMAAGRMSLLILGLYRPGWSHDWDRWEHYEHLTLRELGHEAQYSLLCALLAVETVSDAVAHAVLSRTRGNPLYIQEVVRSLQESGYLSGKNDPETIAGLVRNVPVPDKVESVILARTDRLSRSSRDLVQMAAVVGQEFSHALLKEMLDETGRAKLDQDLGALVEGELVAETGAWPEMRYAFRHALIQESVYANLLSRSRRTMHRVAGAAMERLYTGSEELPIEQIAHHYSFSDDVANAIRYCLLAARRAAHAWARQTAIEWYDRALAKCQECDQATSPASGVAEPTPNQVLQWQVEAMEGKADVLVDLGHNDQAIDLYERAVDLIVDSRAFDIRHQADVYYRIAIAHHHKGNFDAAENILCQGLTCLDGLACLEAGKIQVWRGLLHYRGGRLVDALEACKQGIRLIEQEKSTRDLAQACNLQGIIYRNMGEAERAIQAHEASISLYKQVAYLPGLDRAYTNLGCVYQDLGHWDRALDQFVKSAGLSERTGEQRQRAAAYINLSEIYYLKGELDRAINSGIKARAIAENFGFEDYLALVAINLGKTYLRKQDLSKAARHLNAGLDICRRLSMDVHMPEILRSLAHLEVMKENLRGALAHAHAAVDVTLKMGHREVGQSYRVLGMVHCRLGEFEEAARYLDASLRILEEQNNRYEVGLSLAELALLAKAQIGTRDEDPDTLRSQGLRHCERAIAIFRELGASRDEALVTEIASELQP